MSVIKLTYKIQFIKTFSSKDFFSYFKKNSSYFLKHNAEEYKNIFEKCFIISNNIINLLNHYHFNYK